jgi:hypothetical protein
MPSSLPTEPWPAALDALTAAPEHHALLFENDAVRVLETRIPPGDTTRIHTHRWPSTVYFISRSAMIRRDGNGDITFDSRTLPPSEPARVGWLPPLGPHSIENVGDAVIHVISVELKQAPDSGTRTSTT